MANNCYFEMKIAGPEKAVEEFVQMLQWKGPFKEYGLGRVFSFEIPCPDDVERDPKTGNVCVFGSGDCAWSMKTALMDGSPRSLLGETARLGLVVEAFSSEPGICFQEHILFCKDEIIINDVVDYEEHWIQDASEEYIEQVMEKHHLTREELMAKVDDNGDFCVGGFDNFGDFDNLLGYFEPDRKPSLAEQISSAAARSPARQEASLEKGKESDWEIH